MEKRDKLSMLVTSFLLIEGEVIPGDEVSLVVVELRPENVRKGYVPGYEFAIVRNEGRRRVGRISLRLGDNEYLDRYIGHIGYRVDWFHRGNGYAYKACLLLEEIARRHGFEALSITCSPDNLPSKKTIEKLGSVFICEEAVPRKTELYRRGERRKLRYLWQLPKRD